MAIKIRTIKEALNIIKDLQRICKAQKAIIERLKNEKLKRDLPPGFDNLFNKK